MKVSILTVFPELYTTFVNTSLLKKAQEQQLLTIDVLSFFSQSEPKQRIDAPTYGPGSGMLLKPLVIQKAIEHQEKKFGNAYKIFFSPQGKKLDQSLVKKIAKKAQEHNHLMLVASRYEGMDERVESYYADEVISLGDFVLMAGDLPAQVVLESVTRLVPGVVGKQESVVEESFSGPLVDYPEYTAPVEWKGMEVPEIVRSGNHEAIRQWRLAQAAKKSVIFHFDWFRSYPFLEAEYKKLAQEFIPSHYACLMHSDVVLANGNVGNTSITSLDIHDIARSAKTYDLQGYFLVTPLEDQKKIANTFLKFWKGDVGLAYNPSRHDAVNLVEIVDSLEAVIAAIKDKHGVSPILIATSAKKHKDKQLSYWQQSIVWRQDRPVLFLFGTASGLSEDLLDRVDYILGPIEGLSDFNHLSVRSAVSIVLDRWLGLNPRLERPDC